MFARHSQLLAASILILPLDLPGIYIYKYGIDSLCICICIYIRTSTIMNKL